MLTGLLRQHRPAITDRWFQRILASYPSETQRFLTRQKDPFANPVGAAILQSMDDVFDHLLGDGDRERLAERMQHLIRIRAVQQFEPAQAVGFVFQLKAAVREQLADELTTASGIEALLAFESVLDDVAMVAFEKYVEAREELYQIQLRAVHRETHKLVERMNRMSTARHGGGEADADADDEEESNTSEV